MPEIDVSQTNAMRSRVEYRAVKAGATWLVRRVERRLEPLGTEAGSIRIVGRHHSAAEAEQDACALQDREPCERPPS
jgi:hypothetical protein